MPGNSAFCLCRFACSGYFLQKEPDIHDLLSLASFTEHTVFEDHPSCGIHEHSIPFYGRTVSHWVAGPRLVCPPVREVHVGCPAFREDAAVGVRVRMRAGVPAFNSLGTAWSCGNSMCNFLKNRLEFLYKVQKRSLSSLPMAQHCGVLGGAPIGAGALCFWETRGE